MGNRPYIVVGMGAKKVWLCQMDSFQEAYVIKATFYDEDTAVNTCNVLNKDIEKDGATMEYDLSSRVVFDGRKYYGVRRAGAMYLPFFEAPLKDRAFSLALIA